jgi:catalase
MEELGDALGESLVDAINAVSGVHAGFRAAHAKGVCCLGRFTATAAAAALTRASHLQGAPVPVTVRFSNGSGEPTAHDGARDGRGMATKFHLPGGEATDIVALTLPVFFVRTPDDFLAFMRAREPDPTTGQPDMGRLGAFLSTHPETQGALAAAMAALPPASYVQAVYHSLHAFRFSDAAGRERFVRYRWLPEAGTATLSDEDARKREPDYLQQELRERLAAGPAVFTLELQLAGPDDDLTDPTAAWPETRQTVVAGRLELTGMVDDHQAGCEALIFDPTRVTDGIGLSDDPILDARRRAYSASYTRRTAAHAT